MGTIINLALPFFAIILLGVLAAKVFHLEERTPSVMHVFVVYFALPSMIYLTVASAPFEKLTDWPYVLVTATSTYLAFILPFVFSVLFLATRITPAAIQGTAASFGNVGYLGLPLSVAFFGPEAAVPAALIFCFNSALQFSLTPLLATLGQQEGKRPIHPLALVGKIAKSIGTHPLIIATVLGALASAFRFEPPMLVANLLSILSKAAGPCALFALGVTVGARHLGGMGAEFPLIVATKLVLHPLLVFAGLSLLGGIDPLWMGVAMMMAALPTASNAFILGTQYNAYVEGASSAILITTLLSGATLPLLIYAIQHDYLFAFTSQ